MGRIEREAGRERAQFGAGREVPPRQRVPRTVDFLELLYGWRFDDV